jgi:acetolactate synthase-1/2/3 large subunit
MPVFMSGAGRGSLPTSPPNAFAQARGMALGAADLVLILGAPLDFRLGYGRPPTFAEQAQVVMIDCDAAELGRNRPLALGVVGDLGVVLRQAVDLVPRTLAPRVAPWLTAVRAKEMESRAKLERFCASDETPISHYRLAAEIARVVGADTTVVGDGGDVVGCASRIVPLYRPGQWLDPGPLGCLGVGPSFALTAKLLRPQQRVVLIAGDGALGLNAMELETAVRFRLPLVCVVGNDGGWGQIRNPQLSFYGEARAVATSLPATRFDLLAEALGARGALVTEPEDIRPTLDKALDSGEVWCINVLLDPAAYRKTGTVSMAI